MTSRRPGDFYKEVFGFQDAETRKTRDHVSRHMTDGAIDFTLMKYDEGTQSAESKASRRRSVHPPLRDRGRGPRRGDRADQVPRLRAHQRPGRDAGQVPRAGRHRRRTGADRPLQASAGARQGPTASCTSRSRSTMSARTGDFYRDVFGFRDSETKQHARPHLAPHDRRQHRLRAAEVRRRHAVGRVRRRPATARASTTSPSRCRTSPRRPRQIKTYGVDHRQRSGRDAGQVPRARRHRGRAGAARSLPALTARPCVLQRRLTCPPPTARRVPVATGDFWSGLVLAALGGYIARGRGSWVYLGEDGPGPGFFPIWYGGAMLALSLLLVAGAVLKPGRRCGPPSRGDWANCAAR